MKESFAVYSWDDIVSNKFPSEDAIFKSGFQGTALSVGGFDGVHLGHQELLKKVLERKNLLPGVVTFSNLPASFKNPSNYNGSVCKLQQKNLLFSKIIILHCPFVVNKPKVEQITVENSSLLSTNLHLRVEMPL